MSQVIAALVGRPNVGKSTLFNRLTGEQISVVEDIPGTTRDRLYAPAEWSGKTFTLIDTGGIEGDPSTEISRLVRAQAQIAVDEADLIILCVDTREGLTSDDEAVADLLRRSTKPVVVAATKADNTERRWAASELYSLGFDEVITVSALHGTGTGDLLDWIVGHIEEKNELEDSSVPKFAIIGRPNVGKSSLLNALVGSERSIVSPIPGTTRDSIDTPIDFEGQPIVLIDTAGIRRRGRVEVGIEKYSVIRSLRAIDRADVVLLVIDAEEGPTAQDTHLAGYIRQTGRGCILVINKWDLVARDGEIKRAFDVRLKNDFKFMPWSPIVHISAKNKSRINQPISLALAAWAERRRRVPTGELNRVVRNALAAHAPPTRRGQPLKIYYATQAETEPPTFVFFVNNPDRVHLTYERFLENQLRLVFPFEGSPIRLRFRGREPFDKEDRVREEEAVR